MVTAKLIPVPEVKLPDPTIQMDLTLRESLLLLRILGSISSGGATRLCSDRIYGSLWAAVDVSALSAHTWMHEFKVGAPIKIPSDWPESLKGLE